MTTAHSIMHENYLPFAFVNGDVDWVDRSNMRGARQHASFCNGLGLHRNSPAV